MSWTAGTKIFDCVCESLLSKVDKLPRVEELKADVIRALIVELEANCWIIKDQEKSRYCNHPMVRMLIQERHPELIFNEDKFNAETSEPEVKEKTKTATRKKKAKQNEPDTLVALSTFAAKLEAENQEVQEAKNKLIASWVGDVMIGKMLPPENLPAMFAFFILAHPKTVRIWLAKHMGEPFTGDCESSDEVIAITAWSSQDGGYVKTLLDRKINEGAIQISEIPLLMARMSNDSDNVRNELAARFGLLDEIAN